MSRPSADLSFPFSIFAVIGVVALIGGLIADESVAIPFGVAFLIAALGQHWAYRNSPREVTSRR